MGVGVPEVLHEEALGISWGKRRVGGRCFPGSRTRMFKRQKPVTGGDGGAVETACALQKPSSSSREETLDARGSGGPGLRMVEWEGRSAHGMGKHRGRPRDC